MEPATRLARVRAWIGRPLGRALLALSGLVVLSLVGRFAVAGGGQASPVASGGASALVPPPITSVAISPVAQPPTTLVDAAAPVAVPVHHAGSASEDDPVYLNEATIDDLRRLPGVGEKRGMAILEQRRKQGRFRQVEDLLHIKGMGRATLRRLRPLMKLDHPVPEAGTP
jgi:competence protein ComEA